MPEARTQKQAEQVEVQLRQAIFDQKYSQASAVTRFIDFVDGTFEPWAKENKRSWRDDKQRAKRLKKFFGNRPLRDIKPPPSSRSSSRSRGGSRISTSGRTVPRP